MPATRHVCSLLQPSVNAHDPMECVEIRLFASAHPAKCKRRGVRFVTCPTGGLAMVIGNENDQVS